MLDSIKRVLGVREKPDPRELLGLIQAVGGNGESGGAAPPFELYTLLEDEKIPKELQYYILGYTARDTKLSYLTEQDIKYLFWMGEALVSRIEMKLYSQLNPPDKYPTIRDYAEDAMIRPIIAQNLRVLLLSIIRRATYGFERRLQTQRHYTVSYAPPAPR